MAYSDYEKVAGTSPASSEPLPPVKQYVEKMPYSVGELHETITRLADRLEYVMTPPAEIVSKVSGDKPEPTRSVLAHQLYCIDTSVSTATARLRDLINRLEI